jgi:hypothetical protein
MLTKFLDKISEKIINGMHKFHEWVEDSKSKEPPKINTKLFERAVLRTAPKPVPEKYSEVKNIGFPKELKVKEIEELPEYLKDVSKTIITIEENEMEKVVKVIIDIGPNLKDVMKEIVDCSTSPGGSIQQAFGPFLLESAKNIVLVLKENTENNEPETK